MYNNIDLQTPRGSGTSGFISANKAKPKQLRSKMEFLKELKQLRENILPPPRKANQDILLHKQKREIFVKLEELRQQLLGELQLTAQQIDEQIKVTEVKLLEKFEKKELAPDLAASKDSHALAMIKEQEQAKLKGAFSIQDNYAYGAAFDFETQEKSRLERLYKKELEKVEKMKQTREREKAEKERAKKEKRERKEKKRAREGRRESRSRSRSGSKEQKKGRD